MMLLREKKLNELELIKKEIEITKNKLDQLHRQAYKLQYELGYYAKNEILYGEKYDEPS